MVISESLKRRYYPDGLKDGTLLFFNWIREYCRQDYVVLNFGAGPTSDRKICSFKGEVKKVIGVDVDNVVFQNQDLDQAFMVEKDKLPFPDNYFDLCFSDFVMEHLDKPKECLQELYRVLKPGSSFFFRTPNLYHYVSLIGRMTPHWFHKLVANRVRGLPPDAFETHPTFYSFNCKSDILNISNLIGYRNVEIKFIEPNPSYMVFHPIPFLLGVAYERIVNAFDFLACIRVNIFGRLEK